MKMNGREIGRQFLITSQVALIACLPACLTGQRNHSVGEHGTSGPTPPPSMTQAARTNAPSPNRRDLAGNSKSPALPPVAFASQRTNSSGSTSNVSSTGSESLRKRLTTTQLSGFKLENEESLRAAIDMVRIMTGLPLVVMAEAEVALLDEGVVFNVDLENPISARHLFNLLVDLSGDTVRWTIRHDTVIFTTPEKAREELVTKLYDVRATTRPRTDFRGPRLDRIRLLGEGDDEAAYGSSEASAPALDGERLIELIRSSIAPKTWDEDGVSIEFADSGLLIVRNTPEVQRQVARFLSRL